MDLPVLMAAMEEITQAVATMALVVGEIVHPVVEVTVHMADTKMIDP